MTALVGRLPLRLRLTLAFAGACAVLLAAVGVFIFYEVKSGLDASLDATLRSTASDLVTRARHPDHRLLRRALAVEGEPAQLLAADGRVVEASPRGRGRPLLRPAQIRAAVTRGGFFERHESIRLIARPVGGGAAVVVSTSMKQRERALDELGQVLLIGGPLILLLSSTAGYLVASGALRPVDRMRRRAAEISAATPEARLPLPRTHDELHRLGETLNAMLGRLEAAAQHERAFLATASHELRTPLAILKTEVDLALHEDAGESELRAALESIREEADRLIRLAEDLLVVARGVDGTLPLQVEPVALDDLSERLTERFTALSGAEVRNHVPVGLAVPADRLRLEQAVGNLIDNALRHGAPPVDVSAARDGDGVVVHVTDAGHGFRESELAQAFDGLGSSRSGGFGLGLAIVATIARAHGGTVGVANGRRGADVWLRLPAA